jgi:NADPH2:quinone reductase
VHALTIASGRLEWTTRPDPVPQGSQLLVMVRAAGVNPADLLQVRGHYPPPPDVPQDVPGLELAGTVVAVGPLARRFKVGDRVMGLVGGGAQAELAVVDESVALEAPGEIDWGSAGGFMEAFATAYDALIRQGGLTVGARVLVTGAAGGVGTAAVQLAAVAGAQVTASARRTEFHARLCELGAHRVMVPADAAGAGPYDLVLELVGGPMLSTHLGQLGTSGRLVVIGVGAGRRIDLDLSLLMARRAGLVASTLRARPLFEKAALVRALGEKLLPQLATGRLLVPVAAAFPFADAPSAYSRVGDGGNFGKVVLLSSG